MKSIIKSKDNNNEKKIITIISKEKISKRNIEREINNQIIIIIINKYRK